MAVAYRTYWTGASNSGSRDTSVVVTTITGDYLVIFHFKDNNSSNDTVYEYDGGGTNLIKLGEYARGGGSEIVAYLFDPAGNLGTKVVHTGMSNGIADVLTIIAYQGVRIPDAPLAHGSSGLYYTSGNITPIRAAENLGLYVGGWNSSGGYITASAGVGGPIQLRQDWTYGGRNQIWDRQATGPTASIRFDSDGSNGDKSGWTISLPPTMGTNSVRIVGFWRDLLIDLKRGLIAPEQMKQRMGGAWQI